MNIYKISCYSKCNSYFASYLQSVTVVAKDENEAITTVKEWLKEKGENFLYHEKEWSIDLLLSDIVSPYVIDWHNNSDY